MAGKVTLLLFFAVVLSAYPLSGTCEVRWPGAMEDSGSMAAMPHISGRARDQIVGFPEVSWNDHGADIGLESGINQLGGRENRANRHQRKDHFALLRDINPENAINKDNENSDFQLGEQKRLAEIHFQEAAEHVVKAQRPLSSSACSPGTLDAAMEAITVASEHTNKENTALAWEIAGLAQEKIQECYDLVMRKRDFRTGNTLLASALQKSATHLTMALSYLPQSLESPVEHLHTGSASPNGRNGHVNTEVTRKEFAASGIEKPTHIPVPTPNELIMEDEGRLFPNSVFFGNPFSHMRAKVHLTSISQEPHQPMDKKEHAVSYNAHNMRVEEEGGTLAPVDEEEQLGDEEDLEEVEEEESPAAQITQQFASWILAWSSLGDI